MTDLEFTEKLRQMGFVVDPFVLKTWGRPTHSHKNRRDVVEYWLKSKLDCRNRRLRRMPQFLSRFYVGVPLHWGKNEADTVQRGTEGSGQKPSRKNATGEK